MLNRLKKLMVASVVALVLFVASAGIEPASFFLWYQPELPKEH